MRSSFSSQSPSRAIGRGGRARPRVQAGMVAAAMPDRSPLKAPPSSRVRRELPPSTRLGPPNKPRARGAANVAEQEVEGGAAVGAHHRAADRDVLGAGTGGAGGFGEERDAAGPGDVVEDGKGPLPPVGPELVPAAERNGAAVVAHAADGAEIVGAAEARAGGGGEDALELACLGLQRLEGAQGGGAAAAEQADRRRRVEQHAQSGRSTVV